MIQQARWFEARADKYSTSAYTGYAPHAVLDISGEAITRDWGDGSNPETALVGFHIYQTPGVYRFKRAGEDYKSIIVYAPKPELTIVRTTEELRRALGCIGPDGNALGPPLDPGAVIYLADATVFEIDTPLTWKHWQTGHGWQLVSTNNRAIIPGTLRWTGDSPEGCIFNVAGAGMANVAFRNIRFEGGNGFYTAAETQGILFDHCAFTNVNQGIVFSRPAKADHCGLFIYECAFVTSEIVQLSYAGASLAVVNNIFNYSGNHAMYLHSVDGGLIAGNSIGNWAFGRCAIRLGGTGYFHPRQMLTQNVEISNNDILGWVDPRTDGPSHNGNGNAYNITGIQLGSSTGSKLVTIDGATVDCGLQQIGPSILCRHNTVEDCIEGIKLDSCLDVTIEDCDVRFAEDDVRPGAGVIIGTTSETYGLLPCRNVALRRLDIKEHSLKTPIIVHPFLGDGEHTNLTVEDVAGWGEPEPEPLPEPTPQPGPLPDSLESRIRNLEDKIAILEARINHADTLIVTLAKCLRGIATSITDSLM